MKPSDVAAMLGMAALMMPSGVVDSGSERSYRLRNKTAHGRMRKAKNKQARASRKRNRKS